MTLVLDADVLVAVLRGDPRVLRPLRALREVPATSAVAADAVLAAARPGHLPAVGDLLGWLHVLPVGLEEARLAAGWRRARPGLPATTALTAACAGVRGLTLVRLAAGVPLDGVDVRRWEAS